MTTTDDTPTELDAELADPGHDALRRHIRRAHRDINELRQMIADITDAKGDHYTVDGPDADGLWTWTRYDAQGRAIGHGDRYTRRADAERGAQRANPGLR